jgi:hypothetical protein
MNKDILEQGTEPNGLDFQVIPSSQYDIIEYTEESLAKVFEKIIEPVGEVLVVFSQLEHTLDVCIASLLNNRSDQLGMTVTKTMDYMQKVNLYYDLATRIVIDYSPLRMPELKMLRKNLQYMGELRNVVAHAKWMSMTTQGYVRSQVRISKATGLPEIKYYKLNKTTLESLISRIGSVENDLDEFNESLQDNIAAVQHIPA